MNLRESLHGASVIRCHGTKLNGGIYLVSIELQPDQVVCSIFTSRPVDLGELRQRLTLTDSVGTEYAMQPSDVDAIDGHGTVEFAPGLSDDATNLTLGVPGSWFTAFARREPPPDE